MLGGCWTLPGISELLDRLVGLRVKSDSAVPIGNVCDDWWCNAFLTHSPRLVRGSLGLRRTPTFLNKSSLESAGDCVVWGVCLSSICPTVRGIS
jgi:hypothetical protein